MSEVAPYLATVVEHYRRPHNRRALDAPTAVHEGTNLLCGDRVRMEVVVHDGVVADVGFAASACAIATASASLLTERIRGRPVDEALRTDEESVVRALGAGVPAARRGCATLPWRVLREALEHGG
ncbi:MAG: iron-sulfur cluster assembly scaffold protein [Gemmatimonadaceae bacterium]|nr:iron-sulfur cluster assembly scaffold protein [Gemmatimonadaceae bacterium]NUO96244.1 iron-sulfur cluster assembly scaffold protein [Gemmatimonadaceae bacterium]NUP57831.1 iron-sulfur cluster assembly scaffold protein [Gemmatimonadaceae bacterium]NUP72171.1 iron-sulfur cluster assembly scaffold protein [Gemmatimonadaceae bacterium]NUR35443.1 iron-sulfur cluster assembly scaffold protein [Gemmatimonadaceae bacterium]